MKESSFFKSDLTDFQTSDFLRIFWKKTILAFQLTFSVGFYIKMVLKLIETNQIEEKKKMFINTNQPLIN